MCEKYYEPMTVQYYIANWVRRLNLLDLQTNWTEESALGMELVCMWVVCVQGAYCTSKMTLHIYILKQKPFSFLSFP